METGRSNPLYDVAVIGAGMIGSAAAKYLAGEHANNVVLIGPEEADQNTCHGAWFDEGRITRVFDMNPFWQELAFESIKRYREIERKSAVSFFGECGYAFVGGPKDEARAAATAKQLQLRGVECMELDKRAFPFLDLPGETSGFYQPDAAGYINPRKLVMAQQKLARMSERCQVVNDVVVAVERRTTEEFSLLLKTSGNTIRARKVLVANGAYANCLPDITRFFPPGMELDLMLTTQTLAFLEVSDEQANGLLKNMPTMVTTYQDGKLDGTYILPPIRYADGKMYAKLGHGDAYEREVDGLRELSEWYRADGGWGDRDGVRELERFMRKLIPRMEVKKVVGGCCVTAKTPGKSRPFVDEIHPGLFVSVGGCGYAAKSSDEIGRVAAGLAAGAPWTSRVPREAMEAKWRPRRAPKHKL